MPRHLIALLLLLVLLFTGAAPSPKKAGKVIGITDGDSITVLVGGKPIKVRLYGIDCPERGQPFGSTAKNRTSSFAFGKQCELRTYGKDRYGRTLANVVIGGESLNLNLVKEGFAWHYVKYVASKKLAKAEDHARKHKLGLWGQRQIPPWKWRKLTASQRTLAVTGRAIAPIDPPPKRAANGLTHWLNTNSGVRHNSGCRWHGSTKAGRRCSASAGRACGQCGG